MENIKNLFLLATLSILIACNNNKENKILDTVAAMDYLDIKIASWVDSGYYNGAAVSIIKDNEKLFESYYGGYCDTTALHVASAGKWVASATIAAIVDEGKLSWNDKVNKYLPEFADTKGEATLRQLLSHTAGYPDYQPEGKRRDDYQTLEEAVDNIAGLPADTLPGTRYRYGGLAMQVAGRMAEIATGKDWETLYQEKIGRPLNMKYSYFVPVSEQPGFNPMLGGGLKTCLSDYMNFLNMIAHNGQFEGKQILSQQAINEIEADQVKQNIIVSENYVCRSRQNTHNGIYGLGVWREEIAESGKATLISSPGWAGAYPWVDRKNNVYGFILAKVNNVNAKKNGFSSFYGSAVLPLIVRDAIKQTNYPNEIKNGKINIGQAQLYYQEMGEGEPVIFLHGHSLDHRMWDEQFFEIAKKYRAIRFDFRGYGYSSPQKEGQQFTHVEDLKTLMDSLRIGKAHIVGLSLGGYIGTDMLGWFPERVESAILASGNVRSDPKPSQPMTQEESQKRDKEITALKTKGIDVMKREWFEALMKSGGSQNQRMSQPLWNMIYQWDAWQPLHKEARVIAGGDAYNKLKADRPSMPVLIVEGKSEDNRYMTNPEILEHLPNGKFVLMEDCGHMLNMEQPEAFNKIIIDFFDRNIKY